MTERTGMSALGISWIFLLGVLTTEISGKGNLKSSSIFINKEIYGPGETVRFGFLDLGGHNYDFIIFDITISDSKQNIVSSWQSYGFDNLPSFGSYDLRLGSLAQPGKWTIKLIVGSFRNSSIATSMRNFEVRAVGAPRFSILNSLTYNFTDDNNKYDDPRRYSASLTVAVSAVYESGAGVMGRCEMTLRIIDNCGTRFLPEIFPEMTSEFEISGLPTMHSVDVTPYIANDKHPARKNLREMGGIFEIVLKVTEKFTGQAVTEVARTSFSSRRKATLAVFANAPGKLISDAISLEVANWTRKERDDVGFSVSANIVEPGENVSLTIKAKPGYYVYYQVEDALYEDPDEFPLEKWLRSESGFIPSGIDDAVIKDGMTTEEITRILANHVNLKNKTDGNPTCKDTLRGINPRRRLFRAELIDRFGENQTFTAIFKLPEEEVSWRIKGFVVLPKFGRRIEILRPAMVKILKPIKISMNLPLSLVAYEKLLLPVLISHTAEDPKNVTEVRLVMKMVDAKYAKTVICTKIANGSQLQYACPMEFFRIGNYSIIVEAKILGSDLKKSSEEFLNVRSLDREIFPKTAISLLAFPFGNKASPPCLDTRLGNESSRIPDEDEAPILFLSSDLYAAAREYMRDGLESSFPGGSLESNLLHLTANHRYLRRMWGLKRFYSFRYFDESRRDALYQNILSFKRSDGSFAEFGEKSANSSIWLTAWVIQTLVGADTSHGDKSLILGGLNYLKYRTEPSFVGRHPGASMHLDDAKNDPKDLALAAYVLVTFLKAWQFDDQMNIYVGTIEKARKYLRDNFNSSDASFYAKTLIAYSEHIWEEKNPAGRSERAGYITALWDNASGNYTPGYKELTSERLKVEFHSYMVLMNYYKKFGINVAQEVNQILRGLRSPSEFLTAFETATAISALANVTENEREFLGNYQISVLAMGQTKSTEILANRSVTNFYFNVYVLPEGTNQVCIDGIGEGVMVAELHPGPLDSSYYEDLKNISGRFQLMFDPELTNDKDLKMKFSTRNKGKAPSKMAVAEVNLPSGYNFIQPQTNLELRNVSSAKYWEYLNGNSKLEIYFESLPPDVSFDFNLFAGKRLEVTKLEPAVVRIYELNNPADESQVIYEISGVSV